MQRKKDTKRENARYFDHVRCNWRVCTEAPACRREFVTRSWPATKTNKKYFYLSFWVHRMTSCGDAIPGVDSKKSSAPSASTTRLTAAFFAGGNDYVAIKKEKTVAETKPPAAERQLPTNKDEPKVVAPERKVLQKSIPPSPLLFVFESDLIVPKQHRHHHHRSAADTEDGKTKDADGGSTKKKCCKKRKTSEPAECPKKRKRTDAADADKADESRRDAVPPASEDKGNAAKVLPVEEAVNDDDEQTAPDPPPRKKRRGDDREDAISVSARNIGEDVFGSIPPESSDDRGSVLSSSFFLTDGKKDDDAAPIQIDDSGGVRLEIFAFFLSCSDARHQDDEECAEIPGDMHLPSLTISAPIASVTTTDSRRRYIPVIIRFPENTCSATPYGLPTARNAGNWSTLPKLGRPGDEWTPFATTRALIALRERIDGLVITVKEMRR